MRPFLRLAAVLAFFSSTIGIRADTYRIYDLGTDERGVYGLDAYGHVAFYSGPGSTFYSQCGGLAPCYDVYTFGVQTAAYTTSPGLVNGPDNGTPCSYSSVNFVTIAGALCNNGHVLVYGILATAGVADYRPLLYLEGNPSQPVSGSYAQVFYKLDSRGDVIFGQGNIEEAFEYYDLSTPMPTVPEPSSMALSGTGLLAIAAAARRLRRS